MRSLKFLLVSVVLLGSFFILVARLEAEDGSESEVFDTVPEPSAKIAPDTNGSVIDRARVSPFGNVEDAPVQSPTQVRQDKKFRLFPEGLSSALSGKPQEKIPENPIAEPEELKQSAFGKVPVSRNTSPFGNVPQGLSSSPFGNVPERNPNRP